MTIHKEGFKIIIVTLIIVFALHFLLCFSFGREVAVIIFIPTFIFWLFIVSFFRIPKRVFTIHPDQIIAPADGKVVAIEEIFDEEFFKEKVIQISIFMSPLNVHVNRNPVDGEVVYSQYHEGKYLAAWHPKSSTENERWSVATKNNHGTILYKQIAGAVARRICNYVEAGKPVKQCNEFGFIKFGSRVDVLLPLGVTTNVHLNQKVEGGITVLATWS
jgi:phosphatidylserine decarboxylase precursor-related protein